MKILKNKYNALLIIFLFSYSFLFSQIKIKGRVTYERKALEGATVTIKRDGKTVKTFTTPKSGKFYYILELNENYIIEVSKPYYVTEKIEIDTRVPSQKLQEGVTGNFSINIDLIELFEELDLSILEKPIAKIKYFPEKDAFDYDRKHFEKINKYVTSLYEQYYKLKEEGASPVKEKLSIAENTKQNEVKEKDENDKVSENKKTNKNTENLKTNNKVKQKISETHKKEPEDSLLTKEKLEEDEKNLNKQIEKDITLKEYKEQIYNEKNDDKYDFNKNKNLKNNEFNSILEEIKNNEKKSNIKEAITVYYVKPKIIIKEESETLKKIFFIDVIFPYTVIHFKKIDYKLTGLSYYKNNEPISKNDFYKYMNKYNVELNKLK